MKNDGQCWIHIPVDLTDPTVSDSAAAMINQLHVLIGKPTVSTGATNPYYLPVTQIGIATGSSVDRSSSLAVCGPITNTIRVPLDFIDLVVAVGGDVEGLPFWFELTDINTVCPLSTATPQETWATWSTFGQSHVPVQYGNKWYRSNDVGQSGTKLNASQIASVRHLVISQQRFKEIQEENQSLQP